MTATIKIRQYVIFIKPQIFDTADIKCFYKSGQYTEYLSHFQSS